MRIWELNLRHLQAVARMFEFGTMSAAAKAVNLTQPAITQALGKIETVLGVTLFERRHDGMVPTAAAHLLVPRIEAALAHISNPHVTMSRMRALLALAGSGSYTAASVSTGLSPPSLHRAVSDLALSLRATLVERRGKGAVLSEAGQRWTRRFRLAQVELETGFAELDAMRGVETRSIIVGAMPLARARVLPAAVSRFLRRRPHVRISILEGSRGELVELLRNGAIDLMIGALREPLLEPELSQQALFHDRPQVFARKGHPLDGTQPTLADLAAYPWIVAAPSAPLRAGWEAMFRSAGLDLPAVPIESGSVMTIRQLLLESDYLTVLSTDQVAVELEAGWLTTICPAADGLKRTIGTTIRASWRPTDVQAEFLEDIAAVATVHSGRRDID